ncbi:hypothetical protein KY495_06575 [Massilia sp. PAMC28688]|uniref:hypothetical protein n=1 Tax=Massilia sp. PAMC28688 TaxID=2861283 RepID=UPI001C629C30|nr:hypothetical protein [Massilia sp. PAMC28688]QYF94844.1 hypothetical protein KY495_06575 [Massilia sp. PAMC28688]
MVDPDLGDWNYENDVLGARVQDKDAKLQVTKFAYDKLGRLTNRDEVDLKSTWVYDNCNNGIGRLCSSSTDNGFSSTNVHDALGRLSTNTRNIDGSHASGFTYDTHGRLDTLTYPGGFAVKYGYTGLGYLNTVSDKASAKVYWSAVELGAAGELLRQKYGNNIETQQVFDPNTGELKNVFAGAGNSVQNLTFTYDDVGNMLSRADATQLLSETFHYVVSGQPAHL